MSVAAPTAPAPLATAAPPGDDRRRYRMSLDRYLAFEEAQTELKHEWADGIVIKLAGATGEHNDVASNLMGLLWPGLRGRPGKVYGSDMRVLTGAGTRRYPDVSATAAAPTFAPHPRGLRLDLTNPAAVFEVLSESTEATDEGDKLAEYAATDSIRDYVDLAQDAVRIVHRTRPDATAEWEINTLTDPTDVLELPSVGLKATLGEIYEGVTFGN